MIDLMKETEIEKGGKKLFTFAVILSVVGNVYSLKFINLGLGELFILTAIFVIILRGNVQFKLQINRNEIGFIVFFVYAISVSITVALIVNNIGISNTLVRLVRDGFYIFIVFIFSRRYFLVDFAYKLMEFLSIALALFIIIQFLVYSIFHIYLSGLISFLPLSTGNTIGEHIGGVLRTGAQLGYIRPNGFLDEPARCAQLLSIGLIIIMFSNNVKAKLSKVIFISVGMILTTSLNAIILLVSCYFIFYILNIKRNNGRVKVWVVLLPFSILTMGIILYYKIPFIQSVLHRLTYVKTETSGSTVLRLVRGFAFFKEVPITYKIFGIGYGNFLGFKEALRITTPYEEATEYLNTISYIILSSGILGSFPLLISYREKYRESNYLKKAIMILVIITSLGSSVYSSAYMLVTMSIVFSKTEKWEY